MAVFTVDWEDWNHALHVQENISKTIEDPTKFLLNILKKYQVKALFYILGRAKLENIWAYHDIQESGHVLGSHGYYHDHDEFISGNKDGEYRSPYWDTTPMPWPPSGGFFFRLMPLWYLKWAIKKSGVFWIHPHDVIENHPRLKNPLLNLKRHWGLKTARAKLDRLLSEVKFDDPT